MAGCRLKPLSALALPGCKDEATVAGAVKCPGKPMTGIGVFTATGTDADSSTDGWMPPVPSRWPCPVSMQNQNGCMRAFMWCGKAHERDTRVHSHAVDAKPGANG